MPVSNDFLTYVLDQLSRWGGVSARRMFGGVGLYRDGKIFGLIADDVAYLKVDHASRGDFLKAGSAPFDPYPEKHPTSQPTYYEVPAEILENRDEFCRWAERASHIQHQGATPLEH